MLARQPPHVVHTEPVQVAKHGLPDPVEVKEGERTIGVGTHERRLVDQAGFGG